MFPLYPRFFKTYIYGFIYFKIYIFRKIYSRAYIPVKFSCVQWVQWVQHTVSPLFKPFFCSHSCTRNFFSGYDYKERILTMEAQNLVAVEYSPRQQAYHISSLFEVMRNNVMALGAGKEPGFYLIGVFNNENAASEFVRRRKESERHEMA